MGASKVGFWREPCPWLAELCLLAACPRGLPQCVHTKRAPVSLPLLIRTPVHLDQDSTLDAEKAMAPLSSTLAWKIPMGGGAWWVIVHGVAKSRTRLSNFTFTFHFHALQKEMATHSSVLAWRIPWTGKPGGLPSMGSHRVGHD